MKETEEMILSPSLKSKSNQILSLQKWLQLNVALWFKQIAGKLKLVC